MLEIALQRAPDLLAQLPDAEHPQAWLTPGEWARWQQFGQAVRRDQFLAGRRLLRLLLAAVTRTAPEAQWPEVDAQGRSTVPSEPRLHVNLSHSGPWLAAVLSDAPVGIDIETLSRQRDYLALAAQVHSAAQCALLAQLPEADRALAFYRWWTLKESALKAEGRGLDMARMRGMAYGPAEQGCAACAHLSEPGLMLAVAGPACSTASLPTGLAGVAQPLSWQVFVQRNA